MTQLNRELSPKHQKITTTTKLSENENEIKTDSYYEKLAHQKIETEKHITTSNETFLKDIISCLEHITRDGSVELNIKIKSPNGVPTQIVKRWTVKKENYGAR